MRWSVPWPAFAAAQAARSSALVKKLPSSMAASMRVQVLVDDPTGAEIHVPDFGVAHLPVRQADETALGVDQGMRVGGQQGVPVRQRRLGEGVVGRVFAVAPAVEDEQDDGLGTRIRRHEGLPVTSGRGKL
jgi:hypothetical protein